jgi:hypothetical protein
MVINKAIDRSSMNRIVRSRMGASRMEHDALLMSHRFGLAFNRTGFGVACLSSYTLNFSFFMAWIQPGSIITCEARGMNN